MEVEEGVSIKEVQVLVHMEEEDVEDEMEMEVEVEQDDGVEVKKDGVNSGGGGRRWRC